MSLVKSIVKGSDIVGHIDFNVDRSKYMNASEALNCIRMQWYGKNGAKGDAQNWGYARRGQIIEDHVVRSMVAANIPVAFAGESQQSLACDDTRISATPDGIIAWGKGKNEGLEIKSIDPRTNRSNLPKKAHVVQLQIAMALVNKNVTEFNGIKQGKLIYVDASNVHDILEFEVKADNKVLERLAPRAKLLLSTKKAEKLEREGKTSGDGCKYCPFTKVCGVTVDQSDSKKKANKGSKLDDAVGLYVSSKETIDAAKEVQDGAKENIKQELKKRKASEITIGNVDITLSQVAGRTSLDKKAVKKAGIDLSPFEKVGAPSERLVVKVN